MNRNLKALLTLLAASAVALGALAQGTSFNYQGRLNDGTNPANGSYDIQFKLYNDANTPGNVVVGSPVISMLVTVNTGLFTTNLDFGSGVFTGPPRWLEIGVRTNGSPAAYTILTPRQQLTPTPYAILAGNAGNLGGQPPTAFAPVSGSSAYVAKAGDTMTGALNLSAPAGLGFGAATRQMLDLYDNGTYVYGIGVQDKTFYQRTGSSTGGFAWYQGGVHSDAQNDPGGGSTLMTLDAFGNLTTHGIVTGSMSVNGPLTANGGTSHIIIGLPPYIAKGVTGIAAGSGSQGVSGAADGWGVYGSSSTGTGVGGDAPNGVGVSGTSSTGVGVYGRSTSSEAGHFDGKVFISGNASVCTLTIRGGCDLAEPFEISTMEIPKGAVVVIDDANSGRLKLSDRAYDQRVAGIVSGANGINAGISLHQEGTLEGGQNVALSGRVYVLADAASSPIRPGDLLTTSATPGHAMKVGDHAKAQGAIIGKAMSSLKNGRGLVLVLVTLQ